MASVPRAAPPRCPMKALNELLPVLLPLLGVVLLVVAATHAIMRVRDLRAAAGWVAIIVLIPFVGAVLYWLLGINRVQRRAVALARNREPIQREAPAGPALDVFTHLAELARLTDRVTFLPLLAGNRVTPLLDGDATFPAMLDAIESATTSVSLSTYIFDRDEVGLQFVDALSRARKRGVAVRVLVDAVGARYSFPSIIAPLKQRGIRAARFNPTILPWRWVYANLRNHRKICVVDGKVGFTGGINLRDDHLVAAGAKSPVRDLHFRIDGPVVAHLQRTFAEDWLFVTGERLVGEYWFPKLAPVGDVFCRGITDGPDVDIDKLRWVILGGIACARRRVRIASPYFLPEADLIAAITTARLRGIEIDIVLSEENNQALVRWACDAILPELVRAGCRVWKTTGPFDHSKLMIVDDAWVLLGSCNLDPRSLRLNFEFNVECHDASLGRDLSALLESKQALGRIVSLDELQSYSWPRRFRDRLARLFVPYL
jgi:cardiolipin synthase